MTHTTQTKFVLVPATPTGEMYKAAQLNSTIGVYVAANWPDAYEAFSEFYKAMLDAAPDTVSFGLCVEEQRPPYYVSTNGNYEPDAPVATSYTPAAPPIPADCVRYDPDVPPPENADELIICDSKGYWMRAMNNDALQKGWANGVLTINDSPLSHYKVTKWKLPPDFKQHMGGERPADAVGSGKVCFASGETKHNDFIEWVWKWCEPSYFRNIIGYLPDAKEEPDQLSKVIELLAEAISGEECCDTSTARELLEQFAAAIVDAGKK